MKKASLIKRGIAWLCDLCTAFLLCTLCLKLFAPPFQWCTLTFIGWGTLCYFLLCQIIWKRSLFQYLLGAQVKGNSWKYFGWKMLLGIVIPNLFFLFYHALRMHIWKVSYTHDFEFLCTAYDWIGENNGRLFCALCWVVPLSLAEIIHFFIQKRTFAERFSKTDIIQTSKRVHPAIIYSLCAIFLLLIVSQPIQHHRLEKKYGYPAYYSTMCFPSVPLIERNRYIRDFEKNKQDAYTYIMGLFDKYDFVYLIEREHPEYTQWDFFSQLILNDTFAEKVGCITTEYGCQYQQAEVDTFLSTTFASDTDRQKAAAHIIRNCVAPHPTWLGRNIYDFIIRLQEYNITHDSAHQIRWFTGGTKPDWEGMSIDSTVETFCAIERQHDSSIGNTAIHYYKERIATDTSKNKMLVIGNGIHGMRDIFRDYRTSIDYIDDAFPGKVGVVLLPSGHKPQTYDLPLSYGIWQAAAASVGGNFVVPVKGSRLEDQYFTGIQTPEKNKTLKLGHLFDALLFYKTPYEYILDECAYPYFWADNFDDTLSMRFEAACAVYGANNVQELKECLKTGKQHYDYLSGYNKIYDTFFEIVYVFLLLCTLLALLPTYKKKTNTQSEGYNE